jgi:hypothetical protein
MIRTGIQLKHPMLWRLKRFQELLAHVAGVQQLEDLFQWVLAVRSTHS